MVKREKDFRKYTTNLADMVREKPSLTEYWVLDYFTVETGTGVDFYTLIKVKLHTGRTHQIRVHFSSLGFPLVGDLLYGGKKVMKLGNKQVSRQFLHASKIEVQLPNQEWVEAESKLPKDLQDILKTLKKL